MKAQEAFSKIIKDYIEKHPNMTVNALSNRFNFCRKTISKLIHMEVDVKKMDILPVRNFLSCLSNEGIIDEIIMSDPDLSKNLNKNISYVRNLVINKESHILNHDYKDDDETTCLLLASAYKGTSLETVKLSMGESGTEALKELVEKKCLVETEGRYILAEENSNIETAIVLDRKQSKSIAKIHARHYKPQNSGKGINFIGVQNQNVSPKFCNEFQAKLNELHEWATLNLKKEEYRGDIPAFYSLILDSFIIINEKGDKK